jgi:hypothetical protein
LHGSFLKARMISNSWLSFLPQSRMTM